MIKISTIHLGFCFDKGYLPPFYVLLTSVFYHNKANTIVIHAIATGLSDQEKQALIAYVTENGGQIIFYALSPQSVQGLFIPEGGYLTLAMYYRLFFAELVPASVDKLIYIDIDTIVVGDLRPLFQTEIETHPVAAVRDDWMPVREDLGIHDPGAYFNSGVILINVFWWKEKKVTERAIEAVKSHPEELLKYPDQDALNMVLIGDWHKLPVGYNLTGVHCPDSTNKKILDAFLVDKTIIHFSGTKPWNSLTVCTHVYKYKWFEFFEISPVKSFIRYFDVSFSLHFFKKYAHKKLLKVYLDTPILGKIKRIVFSISFVAA